MKGIAPLSTLATVLALAASGSTVGLAQQAQIPTLQVCNRTAIEGSAVVKIGARADAVRAGIFKAEFKVNCSPDEGFPEGSLELFLDLSDSIVGEVRATTFEQVTSTGKHTPTAYISGRCQSPQIRGCRFWLMVADNQRTDVIGFLIVDGTGSRASYGTGTTVEGDIVVRPATH